VFTKDARLLIVGDEKVFELLIRQIWGMATMIEKRSYAAVAYEPT